MNSDEVEMNIEFFCRCGHRMKLPEKYAGLRVRCSRCQRPLQVSGTPTVDDFAGMPPTPPLAFEVVDGNVAPPTRPPPSSPTWSPPTWSPPLVPPRLAQSWMPQPLAARPAPIVQTAQSSAPMALPVVVGRRRGRSLFNRKGIAHEIERERWEGIGLYFVGIGVTLHLIEFLLVVLAVLSIYGGAVYASFKVISSITVARPDDTEAQKRRQKVSDELVQEIAIPIGLAAAALSMVKAVGFASAFPLLFVPGAVRARAMAIIGLVFHALALIFAILPKLMPMNMLEFCACLAALILFQFGTWVALMMFLNRLSMHLRRPYLENESESVIRLGLALWFCIFLLPFVMFAMPFIWVLFGGVIGIGVVILAVAFSTQYIRILLDFRLELM